MLDDGDVQKTTGDYSYGGWVCCEIHKLINKFSDDEVWIEWIGKQSYFLIYSYHLHLCTKR